MQDRSHKGQREASARKRQRRKENQARLAADAAAAGVPADVLTRQRVLGAQSAVARIASFMPKPVTIYAAPGEPVRRPNAERTRSRSGSFY